MNGAPQKPITGVRPSSSRRSSRTASATNGTASAARALAQRVHLRAGAHRLGQLRAGVEGHPHAERLERQQDVGEDDRGVEREAAQRLQRGLDRQLRRLAQRQEVHALAQRAVLRQVAAGLPHDPQRRAVDRLAPAGAQEAVVHARTSAKAAAAAAIVWSITASSCAAETKADSNADGGSSTPRASIARKKRAKAARSTADASSHERDRRGGEEDRPHRADPLDGHRHARRRGRLVEALLQPGAARLERVVEVGRARR